jgi:hypothetical protein
VDFQDFIRECSSGQEKNAVAAEKILLKKIRTVAGGV